MPIGYFGEGPGLTHEDGNDTAVTADKYFKKISGYGNDIVTIQVIFNTGGGTVAGVCYVQGSNLANPTDEAAGSNEWETLDVAFNRAVTTGAGMCSINLSSQGWRWLRVFFDFTSGSGVVKTYTCLQPGRS